MYLLVPCLFLLILVGIYKIAGISIENYVTSQLYMVIEKGNPDYQKYPSDTQIEAAFKKVDRIEKSEVQYPVVGERYAKISCEDIGLDVFLYFGDDEEILKHGAGQYVKSNLPGFGGTVLVCGCDTTYMSSLSEIEVGNIVNVDTEYGRYQYAVRETKVVKSEDIAACQLDSKTEQLVMYTSYPFGEILTARNERFFVYCDKISGPEVED